MKKIIAGIIWLLIGVNASAQTEVTPDMIWREGVTFVREFTVVRDIAEDLGLYDEVVLDTLVYRWEYVLTPINIEGITYFVDYNTTCGSFEFSYRREENGKMYGFAFNEQWDGHGYAHYGEEGGISRDPRDGSMGKEYFIHDFNSWAEGDSVEWTDVFVWSHRDKQLKEYVYTHEYSVTKEKINKLEKLVSPDGDYWMWAYQTEAGEWVTKAFGSYFTCNSYDVMYMPLELIREQSYILGEVRSPEGEIYFRHPDYTPDDELGAIALVTQDNSVNITGNAGEVCVTAAVPTDVEIFTAQGVKVYGASAVKHTTCKLPRGLYIVRAGSTTKKVVIK